MIVQTGHQVGFARIDQHRLRLHRVYFALKVDKQVAHKFVEEDSRSSYKGIQPCRNEAMLCYTLSCQSIPFLPSDDH